MGIDRQEDLLFLPEIHRDPRKSISFHSWIITRQEDGKRKRKKKAVE